MLLPDFPVTKLNWIFHGKCEIDIWCKIPSTWHQAGPRCHTPCAYPAPGVQHQANWHLLCNHCLDTFLSRLHSRYVLQKQCAADKTQTCRIRLLNNIWRVEVQIQHTSAKPREEWANKVILGWWRNLLKQMQCNIKKMEVEEIKIKPYWSTLLRTSRSELKGISEGKRKRFSF